MKNCAFTKANKVQGQLESHIKENAENLRRPVTAFITFQNEEGYNRAIQSPKEEEPKWLGEPVEFEEAPEPTDIIWEHRPFTRKDQVFRIAMVSGITLMMLAATFVVILYLKKWAKAAGSTSNLDCGLLEELYPTGKEIQDAAYNDFYEYYTTKSLKDLSQSMLPCFCEA